MKTNANTCAAIIFTCALLLTPKSISAATLQAATANQSDVQSAILRARDGDTVVVPSTLSLPGGAAIWTSRINVTVGITIKGQTTDYRSRNVKPKYRKSDGNSGQFPQEHKSIWPSAIQPNSYPAVSSYGIHIQARRVGCPKQRLALSN